MQAAVAQLQRARTQRRPCLMFFYSSKCHLCSKLKASMAEQVLGRLMVAPAAQLS